MIRITQEDIDLANKLNTGKKLVGEICPTVQAMTRFLVDQNIEPLSCMVGLDNIHFEYISKWTNRLKRFVYRMSPELKNQVHLWTIGKGFVPGEYRTDEVKN